MRSIEAADLPLDGDGSARNEVLRALAVTAALGLTPSRMTQLVAWGQTGCRKVPPAMMWLLGFHPSPSVTLVDAAIVLYQADGRGAWPVTRSIVRACRADRPAAWTALGLTIGSERSGDPSRFVLDADTIEEMERMLGHQCDRGALARGVVLGRLFHELVPGD